LFLPSIYVTLVPAICQAWLYAQIVEMLGPPLVLQALIHDATRGSAKGPACVILLLVDGASNAVETSEALRLRKAWWWRYRRGSRHFTVSSSYVNIAIGGAWGGVLILCATAPTTVIL